MCNPVQSILDAIADNIVKAVVKSVGRHVGFLFHYKQNLKNLEDEKNNLQGQRSIVQEKVNEANHRGDAIDNSVTVWLEDVEETRQGVGTFMDEKKENMMCFNFSCPDFISRYRLSKQAEKKVVDIKQLAEKGSKIETVSHPQEDPPELELPSSKDYEDFLSRHEVFNGFVKALKDSTVNMTGVYGTGGIGKTTLVEKVGKLLKEDGTFDEVVMAVVSQDANVNKIQGQLADCLNETLSGETEVGRAKKLWKRLNNGKKNLIILDDVWQELDLKKIGIPIATESGRCKVVLTSRKRDVWRNMGVQKACGIDFLSEEESWNLFEKVGNHADFNDQQLHGIARAVCKECKGLPIAIKALGATLKGKDMPAWKDALHMLKNSRLKDIEGIDIKVHASLKLSYDLLGSKDAQSCFLLCCLFAEDAEICIDDLVRYYMAWRTLHHDQMVDTLEQALNRVCTVVGTLKSCCLLLNGESEHLVKMHDVVRDVAISIAEEKSFLVKHGVRYWLEKATYECCSVISLMPQDMGEFPNELVCPELHTLRLDCTVNNKSVLHVPNSFFSGTKNLMVLDLIGIPMSPLPASLANLAKLKMLCLNNCKLGDIAILKDLKNHLEILSLQNSNIRELPLEVGELTRLRLLDMTNCDNLQMIQRGVISKLVLLEELYLPMEFSQWEGTSVENNVSLDELMSLTQLTTLHIRIRDPTLLPKHFTFENLVRFKIAVGQQWPFSYLGQIAGILRLHKVHVENALEYFLGKPKLKRFIEGNGLYPSTSFNHLGQLRVGDCTLKYLFSPSCARGLVRLKELEIRRCRVMEGVIGTEGEKDEDIVIKFPLLSHLFLDDLPNLISFYPKKFNTVTSSGSSPAHAQTVLFNDKASFPALEKLYIFSVPMITEIWDKKNFPIPEIATESPLCQLSRMSIIRCGELMNVVGGCPKIEAIEMEKQKGKVVDDYVAHFPKLNSLSLHDLPNLESFCSNSVRCEAQVPLFDHQVAFPVMEEFRISGLPNITDIWDNKLHLAEPFCPLRELTVENCGKFVNVVPSNMLPQLRNLEHISLHSCPMVEVIINLEKMEEETQEATNNAILTFPKLGFMRLEKLQKIKAFCAFRSEEQHVFSAQVAFPKLEYLWVDTFGEIALRQLTDASELSLKHLELNQCDEVSTIVSPHLFRRLRFVDKLWWGERGFPL